MIVGNCCLKFENSADTQSYVQYILRMWFDVTLQSGAEISTQQTNVYKLYYGMLWRYEHN